MDALAGTISYLHCDSGDESYSKLPLPIIIATAAVDRIDMLKRITFEDDIRIFGKVRSVKTD